MSTDERSCRSALVLLCLLTAGVLLLTRHGCRSDNTATVAIGSASDWRPAADYQPPTVCPFGHHTLKEAKVVYGLMAVRPEDQDKVDNLDLIWGGCCLRGFTSQTVCETCRYIHDPVIDTWSRNVENPADLARPLSTLATGFPVPPPAERRGTEHYLQTVDGRGNVIEESLSYWSRKGLGEIRSGIIGYLKEQGTLDGETRSRVGDRDVLSLEASAKGTSIHVEIDRYLGVPQERSQLDQRSVDATFRYRK